MCFPLAGLDHRPQESPMDRNFPVAVDGREPSGLRLLSQKNQTAGALAQKMSESEGLVFWGPMIPAKSSTKGWPTTLLNCRGWRLVWHPAAPRWPTKLAGPREASDPTPRSVAPSQKTDCESLPPRPASHSIRSGSRLRGPGAIHQPAGNRTT